MPMQRDRYPADWAQISARIRARDGWKCAECGVPNGAHILRLRADKRRWAMLVDDLLRDCDGREIPPTDVLDGFWTDKPTRVVLTVHHKGVPKPDGSAGDPHDKMDVRDENLVALCQRCHLLADLALHTAHARDTRRAKRKAGQLALFD